MKLAGAPAWVNQGTNAISNEHAASFFCLSGSVGAVHPTKRFGTVVG
jgi:hypothetical protein